MLIKLKKIRKKPDDFAQKLANRSEMKLRVGDIRLFIELNRGKLIILILKVGHRKNIYKK
ncbi:MAG: type II toxin-antitoxin system RelE family toxin [Candidatus Kariarchaeaceae archaeon]